MSDIAAELKEKTIRWLSIVNKDFPYDYIVLSHKEPIVRIYKDFPYDYMGHTVYEYAFKIPNQFHAEWKEFIKRNDYMEYYKEEIEPWVDTDNEEETPNEQ